MLADQLRFDIPAPINQDEINSVLWRACDTFRSTVDPSEYKNCILVMQFLRYMSNIWAGHYAQYRQLFGNDDERIRRRMSAPRRLRLLFALQIASRAKHRRSHQQGTGKDRGC